MKHLLLYTLTTLLGTSVLFAQEKMDYDMFYPNDERILLDYGIAETENANLVELLDFSGQITAENNNLLIWKCAQNELLGYEIQRSQDAMTFETIASISVENTNNPDLVVHNYLDEKSYNNSYYYRIKLITKDNSFQLSQAIHLLQTNKALYPNPFENEFFIVNDALQGEYFSLRLLSLDGKVLASKDFTDGELIHLNVAEYGIASGTYIVELKSKQETTFFRIAKK